MYLIKAGYRAKLLKFISLACFVCRWLCIQLVHLIYLAVCYVALVNVGTMPFDQFFI